MIYQNPSKGTNLENIILYLFIKQKPKSRYRGVGAHQRQRKREEGKKRKWWGLAQPHYSPKGNGKQSHRVETMGIDHLMQRITKGADLFIVSEDKRDHGRIKDTFT